MVALLTFRTPDEAVTTHPEIVRALIGLVREAGAEHIRVFGGGGGTITPDEIRALMEYGVARIYHPHDGMELGLDAMIRDLIERTLAARRDSAMPPEVSRDNTVGIAATISAIEEGVLDDARLSKLRKEWQVKAGTTPVIGITGTGGAGKSSVTDEILNRFLGSNADMHIAVLAVDPTRRRTGGALLGDRIRMNTLRSARVFMRSIATRRQHLATSEMLADHITYLDRRMLEIIDAILPESIGGAHRDHAQRPEQDREHAEGPGADDDRGLRPDAVRGWDRRAFLRGDGFRGHPVPRVLADRIEIDSSGASRAGQYSTGR